MFVYLSPDNYLNFIYCWYSNPATKLVITFEHILIFHMIRTKVVWNPEYMDFLLFMTQAEFPYITGFFSPQFTSLLFLFLFLFFWVYLSVSEALFSKLEMLSVVSAKWFSFLVLTDISVFFILLLVPNESLTYVTSFFYQLERKKISGLH